MRYDAFLIKYAEIGIKGKNRHVFEDMLVSRINNAIHPLSGSFHIRKTSGRIYVLPEGEYDTDEIISALQKVFGIAAICPVVQVKDEGFEKLKADVVAFVDAAFPEKNFSFKVMCRRTRKNYPLDSMEMAADLGEALLDAFPELTVNVHEPDEFIYIEVRDTEINIYSEGVAGPGGMPVGSNGTSMLLLSGGIDSPVAGWMCAKRGVALEAVYFHAPPYTSDRAKQKVVDLARIVSAYSGRIKLHVVNFTDIQLAIYEKCPHEELTIIMRRYMMRIAQILARRDGCQALITGESIGQVASQTVQSLMCTNEVCELPVFRPLIAFDKMDIVEISKKIGAYETSIQPFEDCCTIFVAKHPVTKPRLDVIKSSETRLGQEIDEMVEKAIEEAEIIEVFPE
ncbi:MAG: tRNA 4-thiouridine(8) synthase ThiI [Lachnospiraceae bacterium]|nr:tRNA 4-thiouridine(8) synthase ThiI [Lachnospiraceae bacterium]